MAKSLKRVISVSLALLLMVTVFACAFVMPSSAESNDNMIVWNGAPAYSRLLYRPDTGAFVAGTTYLYSFDMEMVGIAEADEPYFWRVFYCNNDSAFTRIKHDDFQITKTPLPSGFHYDVKFTIPDDCRDSNNILLKFGDTGANGYEQTMKVANLDLWSLTDGGSKDKQIVLNVPGSLDEIVESTDTNEKSNGIDGKWVCPKDYLKNIAIQKQDGYFEPEVIEPTVNDNMIVWNGAPAYSRMLYRPDTGAFVAGTKYLYMFDMEMTGIAEADEPFYWRVFYCNNDSAFTRIPHADFEITKTPRANGFHYDVIFTIPDNCRNSDNILLKFGDTGANGYDQTMKVGNLELWSLDDKDKKVESIKLDVPETIDDVYQSNDTNEKSNGVSGKWVCPVDYLKNITVQPQDGYFAPEEEYVPITDGDMIVWNGAPAYSRMLYRPDTGAFVAGKEYVYSFDMEMTGIAEADEPFYWRVFYGNNDSSFTRIPHADFEITKTPAINGFHYDVKFKIPADCRDADNILLKFGDTGANGYDQTMKVANLDLWSVDGSGTRIAQIPLSIPATIDDVYQSSDGNEKSNGVSGKWVCPVNYLKNITIQPQDGYFHQAEKEKPFVKGKMIVWNGAPAYSRLLYRPDTGAFVAGTQYLYSFDMEMVGIAEADEPFYWRVFYCNNDSAFTRIPHADFQITKTPLDTGFHYDVKFTVPDDCRDYSNILLKFGDTGSNGYTQTMTLANLDLWSLDAKGKKAAQIELSIPESLADIYQSNDTNEKSNGVSGKWVCPVNYLKNISIQPQNGYFYPEEGGGNTGAQAETAIRLENAEGTVSQFVTVKPGTDYGFSFKFKSENGAEAEPYIEAFSSDASLGKLQTKYITKDADGYYNYYCEFTTPAGLADANNLRIGISAKQSDTISATGFELFELDSRGEKVGENLINDPDFAATASIDAYDGNPSGNWTFEGTGTPALTQEVFAIPAPQVLLFAGGKAAASIVYDTALTPGDYTVSLNLKYGSEGYEGDTGVELKYHNGSAWVDVAATGGKVAGEFKNTYTMTLPADARTAKENFRVSVKVGSATVTGYVSNLEIYSAGDSETNLAANGDLSLGTEKWSLNGLGYSNIAPLPDGYFKENAKLQRGMFYYRNSTTWDYFTPEYLTLKSNTYYLAIIDRIHPLDTDETDHKCVTAFQSSGKKSDGEYYTSFLDSYKPTKYEGAVCTRHILTPEGLNATNNTKLLNVSQLAGSYGYWGGVELYESNENGDILSNNILLNGDLTLGMTAWKTTSSDGFAWRFVEEPEGFFDNYKIHEDQMITSTGSEANAQFGQVINVERGKKYYFQGQYVNMNAAGVTPKAYYKDENGKWVDSGIPVFVDNDRYYFEMEFELPDEAYSRRGQAEVKFVIENGNKGKGYLSDLAVYEEGSYENLFKDAAFANGTKNWTTSGNYKVTPYDGGLFKFHYDDKAFNDGNWSGEAAVSFLTNGSVVGTVLKGDGNPYKGITMMLEPGGLKAVTNAEGVYRFDELKPGKYSLSLRTPGKTVMFVTDVEVKSGFLSSVSDITLSLEEEISFDFDVDVDLEPQYIEADYGIVRGYLYDVDATLLTNTKIYLGKIAETKTDSKGMFEFGEVPPGKYDLYTKDKDGNVQILKNIEVLAGKGSVYKVQLPFDEESSNLWLIIALIGAGVVVLAGGAVAAILIAKKKKGSNA